MKKPYWTRLVFAEYLSDRKVAQANAEVRGVLITCWCLIGSGGPIPDDPRWVARMGCLDPEEVIRAWPQVRSFLMAYPLAYPLATHSEEAENDGRCLTEGAPHLTSERLEKELQLARDVLDKKAAGGRKGAILRWNSRRKTANGIPISTPIKSAMGNKNKNKNKNITTTSSLPPPPVQQTRAPNGAGGGGGGKKNGHCRQPAITVDEKRGILADGQEPEKLPPGPERAFLLCCRLELRAGLHPASAMPTRWPEAYAAIAAHSPGPDLDERIAALYARKLKDPTYRAKSLQAFMRRGSWEGQVPAVFQHEKDAH